MLGLGSGAHRRNGANYCENKYPRCEGIHSSRRGTVEIFSPRVKNASTLLKECGIAGGARLNKSPTRNEKRNRAAGDQDVAQVQPTFSNSSVFTGDLIGHHVRFIGHFDFPASVSTGGSEGDPSFHLCGHARSRLGRPAAGLHGALCSGPHPSFELGGRVSSPQLFFNRAVQGRAGHRQVF